MHAGRLMAYMEEKTTWQLAQPSRECPSCARRTKAEWQPMSVGVSVEERVMSKVELSAADNAFPLFKDMRAKSLLMRAEDPELTETDTRVKLIDPLFKEVLGWTEADIRREEPAADGFADYSFGHDFRWFHVEAKRAVPR